MIRQCGPSIAMRDMLYRSRGGALRLTASIRNCVDALPIASFGSLDIRETACKIRAAFGGRSACLFYLSSGVAAPPDRLVR